LSILPPNLIPIVETNFKADFSVGVGHMLYTGLIFVTFGTRRCDQLATSLIEQSNAPRAIEISHTDLSS
jgi:hypothetical protein